MPNGPDFTIENHSSIFLLWPQKKQDINWIDERAVQPNGFQHSFPTITVEHRYIVEIFAGVRNDGWVVSA
jgi:hypothetical protein